MTSYMFFHMEIKEHLEAKSNNIMNIFWIQDQWKTSISIHTKKLRNVIKMKKNCNGYRSGDSPRC